MSKATRKTKNSWGISNNAALLHQNHLFWDNTLPWGDRGRPARKAECLPRMVASGFDAVSLTLGGDRDGLPDTIQKIARERTYFLAHPDKDVPWPEINYTVPEELPRLTEKMLKHGYEDAAISGILGGNWLRLAQQVWK